MAVIEVNNLTKEYRLGQLHSLKQSLTNIKARLQGKSVSQRPKFKALDDINFTIEQGEVVGIIGQNGAGKSTLLKMLARISTPTTGSVKVHGRIAPLIEVGAGLIPDLTGRENIYLNATILGMTRKEIDKRFDEIVEFAELGEFIDTPVKRYSSGMMVRLGFSIATSIEAEVLIVDEVLAVGDLAFQRKCFSRMEEIIKRQGTTVLLVSHNIRQVERMCSRVIMLSQGIVEADGKSTEICDKFYQSSNNKIQNSNARIQSSGEIELISIDVINDDGFPIEEVESGNPLRIRVKLNFNTPIEKPEFVVGTHTTDFIYLTAKSTAPIKNRPDFSKGEHQIEYLADSFPLVAGSYCIRVAVFDKSRRVIFAGETLKIFHVVSSQCESLEPPLRKIDINTNWIINGSLFATNNKNHNNRLCVGAHEQG